MIIGVVLVIGFFMITGLSNNNTSDAQGRAAQDVNTTTDQQVVEVTVSGGYYPRVIDAKAGVPTILKMKSESAYGCERAFRIPSLGIAQTLPADGETTFDLGSQRAGTRLTGSCSMGMYVFVINFN